jgi:hypothetical protein
MKYGVVTKAAALMSLAAVMFSTTVIASPIGFSLIDPDPQGVNGTMPTAALSQRTPAGITPVQNDYNGRGYPDTSAYYNRGSKVILPPTGRVTMTSDGRLYYRHPTQRLSIATQSRTQPDAAW